MKEVSIETEKRPIADWLPGDDSGEVIRLTRRGQTRFVVVPWDDMDEEVRLIRKNKELMDDIDQYIERARRGPTESLEEVKKQLGITGKKKRKATP